VVAKHRMNDVTAIVKTFERPGSLGRLIDSLRAFFPNLKILVADDSSKPYPRNDVEYHILPYDVGVSTGRNYLLKKVQTKYAALFDDDHVCTKHTRIDRMVEIMERNPLDLVAGDFINYGRHRSCYHGLLQIDGSACHVFIGKNRGQINGFPLFDITNNFFVARTEKLREVLWDEEIKFAREHADFFLRCRNKLNITYSPNFSVNHFPGEKRYMGERGQQCIERFNSKWGVKARIVIGIPPTPWQRFKNAVSLPGQI